MGQNHNHRNEAATARVISFYGNRATLFVQNRFAAAHVRRRAGTLVAGDIVVIKQEADGWVVESRLQRETELSRPDKYGHTRTLAANVDQLIVTVAVNPEPDFSLIDQYLVLANLQCIRPVLLINKIDVLTDDSVVSSITREFGQLTENLILVSAHQEQGLDQLRQQLEKHTSVFAGQSGVGKSSLVNLLCSKADARTGALSESDGKGRHTTTTSIMYPLTEDPEQAGWIIDSPGIRELNLARIDPAQVADGYSEISEQSPQCRFRNCLHRAEPGCCVRQLVDDNRISSRRYASYLELLQKMEEEA